MYGNYSHFMKFPTGFGGKSGARAAPGAQGGGGPAWRDRSRRAPRHGARDAAEPGGGHARLDAS